MSTTRPPTSTKVSLNPIFNYPTLADRGQNVLAEIADILQSRSPPNQWTLLMDGTLCMMSRAQSTDCATKLSVPLPAATPSPSAMTDGADSSLLRPGSDTVTFQKCRKCAGEYVFQLRSGSGNVTILAGAPKADIGPYKTMSYVWGSPPGAPMSIPCLQCGHITSVPVVSAQRFHNLMELGGGGNTIWLDAISIDQFDKQDVATNVAVMGNVYKNAKCVSVLLPASDQAAYECLKEIEGHAKVILLHRRNFIENSDFDFTDPSTGKTIQVLTTVCQLFLENLKRLGEHLHQFVYWSRAWTFQEWALANDLEVAVEGGSNVGTCFNLKSLVLGAAMLISRYKILQHQYVEIKLGDDLSRGMIPPLFNAIKALFPDEDLFLSYEEIDPKEMSFQANFPHFGVNHLLGVRSVPAPSSTTPGTGASATSTSIASEARPDPLSRTRARLILLLSAFASSKREAKYEADLVACWASMCNISYAYDRNDDFATALRKVVKALRDQGVIVYDFLPDTKGGINSPTDTFRAYAREHPQLNATNQAEFPGSPIFAGRTDTVSHLIFSLEKVSLPTEWNDFNVSGPELDLRKVLGSKVEGSIALNGDIEAAMSAFAAKALYGNTLILEGFAFWAVQDVAKNHLEKIDAERRSMARLMIVKIPFYKHDSQPPLLPYDLYTWAIVPIDIAPERIIVCRESTNGTLTLVVEKDGQYRIIAYLTMSDHLSGTFLVNTDDAGRIDLTLRIPERGDMQNTAYKQIAVRQLRGEVQLETAVQNSRTLRSSHSVRPSQLVDEAPSAHLQHIARLSSTPPAPLTSIVATSVALRAYLAAASTAGSGFPANVPASLFGDPFAGSRVRRRSLSF